MGYQTKAIHGGLKDDSGKGAVNYPIYLSSTFNQPDTVNFREFVYSRSANPTRNSVEKLVAELEEAKYALAFSSGMAATANVFELLSQGDRVLISDNVYGGTWRFVSNLFESRGIQYEVIDDFNSYDYSQAPEDTRMVFIETPSNPLLKVTDIRRAAEGAHSLGALLVVDNTFMTSYLQKPLSLGADIVVYSATKYYAGHSDILAGLEVFNDDALYEKLHFIQNTLGGILSPFDSYLLQRGIKTLGIRLDRHNQNALAIAEYLEKSDAATQVFYPGLATSLDYNIQIEQASGSGGVLSFLLDTDRYDLESFVTGLRYFSFAVSLGGVESLVCIPATMTHESYAPELQTKIGISPNLVRLAVGIEDTGDLLADIEAALAIARK